MSKTVLITGATSGIGFAAAHAFAARGYEVFATYRSAGERLSGVHALRMDVTDAADIEHAYAAVSEAVGDDGLYALVNNAGITYSAPFEFADEARAREVLDVNVMAPFRVTQRFIPLLSAWGERHAVKPRVVNVASWAGLMASPFIPFYNASKFGLIGLTESMFYDLRLLGIHSVLAIPGITNTPLLAKTTGDATASLSAMPADGRARYQDLFDHYATLSASTSSSRMLATPEQVARRLVRIVDRRRPRFKHHLGRDTRLVAHLPWPARVAVNTRLYRLRA